MSGKRPVSATRRASSPHRSRGGAFKSPGRTVDAHRVKLQRCPYDGTPLDVSSYSGGSYLLNCASCDAEWEAHNELIRRTAEPDWEKVRAARTVNARSMKIPSIARP